mmetsp:Transcript_45777/g.108542  ORF Transcript_45777/g.108542 Transcript_45777/m.108542 type:complete len:224 (-) Transcript_45777:364-1035(-)
MLEAEVSRQRLRVPLQAVAEEGRGVELLGKGVLAATVGCHHARARLLLCPRQQIPRLRHRVHQRRCLGPQSSDAGGRGRERVDVGEDSWQLGAVFVLVASVDRSLQMRDALARFGDGGHRDVRVGCYCFFLRLRELLAERLNLGGVFESALMCLHFLLMHHAAPLDALFQHIVGCLPRRHSDRHLLRPFPRSGILLPGRLIQGIQKCPQLRLQLHVLPRLLTI